jgi:hypothetical protein
MKNEEFYESLGIACLIAQIRGIFRRGVRLNPPKVSASILHIQVSQFLYINGCPWDIHFELHI